MRLSCICKLRDRSPAGCNSGVTIWLKPFVVARASGVTTQRAATKMRPTRFITRHRTLHCWWMSCRHLITLVSNNMLRLLLAWMSGISTFELHRHVCYVEPVMQSVFESAEKRIVYDPVRLYDVDGQGRFRSTQWPNMQVVNGRDAVLSG